VMGEREFRFKSGNSRDFFLGLAEGLVVDPAPEPATVVEADIEDGAFDVRVWGDGRRGDWDWLG